MRLILALIAVLLAVGSVPAEAACTLNGATTTTLAASSSYDVRAGGIATVAAPTSLSCTPALIAVGSTSFARATATSANAFRLRSVAGDTIGYRLSADAAGAYPFTQGSTIDYFSTTMLALLGVLSGNTLTPTMFATLTEAPNIPAGTYTDTVTIAWEWKVCRLLGVAGVCVLSDTGTGTTTMTIRIVVGNDCRINAPALDFGSAPLVSQFTAVTQAVAVDCTKGTVYNVAFTAGLSGASRPWRTMQGSSGGTLQYNLYRADGTTIWDLSNPQASALPGTGSLTPSQMQVYVARINPAQPTPPVGAYTDTVSVVVSF